MCRLPPLPLPPPPVRHHSAARMLPAVLFLWLSCCSSRMSLVSSEHHTVTHLPGFEGPLPFRLETGYTAVGEGEYDVELFYYFVESEGNPREDPLLLWLNGGPRCSVISGLSDEIGPITFTEDRYNKSIPTLLLRSTSWTKVSSIIFLDSPDATGFSFSRSPSGYTAASDTAWSKQAHTFIKKWFAEHPQFLSNFFYIGGESYTGKIIPMVAQMISEGIEGEQIPINFKGYLLGNPITNKEIDVGSRVSYAHGMGIISDELCESTKKKCAGQSYNNPITIECAENLNTIENVFSELNMYDILLPLCNYDVPPKPISATKRSLEQNNQQLIISSNIAASKCKATENSDDNRYFWANNFNTRRALRIKEGTVGEWQRCNGSLPYTEDVPSSVGYHFNVLRKGYRALIYSGDHDLVVPYVGTQAWIRSLNFSIVDDWHSWFVDGQVAGYTRTYSNNLTFVTIKGAGHTAPANRHEECLAMFVRWISYRPL